MICWYSAIIILLVSWNTLSAFHCLFIASSSEAILLCSLKSKNSFLIGHFKACKSPDLNQSVCIVVRPGCSLALVSPASKHPLLGSVQGLKQHKYLIIKASCVPLTPSQLTPRATRHEGGIGSATRPLNLLSFGFFFRRGDWGSLSKGILQHDADHFNGVPTWCHWILRHYCHTRYCCPARWSGSLSGPGSRPGSLESAQPLRTLHDVNMNQKNKS